MKVNYQQVLGGLSTLLVFSFCNAVNSAPIPVASSITVEGPRGLIAPRDSLPYVLRWRHIARATGYRVTVTAAAIAGGVASSTGGLPFGAVTTDTTFSFTAVNLTYDSIAFTASVTATSGTRSGLPGTVSWSIVRSLGIPGPIQVDSSAIPPPVASGFRCNWEDADALIYAKQSIASGSTLTTYWYDSTGHWTAQGLADTTRGCLAGFGANGA